MSVELAPFTGLVFEDLCQEWVMEQHRNPPWDFLPMRMGAWWERGAEIEVMAIGDKAVLFGECKWTIRPVGTTILDDLKRKAYPLILRGGAEEPPGDSAVATSPVSMPWRTQPQRMRGSRPRRSPAMPRGGPG